MFECDGTEHAGRPGRLILTVFPLNLWMGRCFYKGFGAVLGDLQESHSGTGWRAQATFP